MCVWVPARLEAYPLCSILITHVCILKGESMNSPFILSTNVCISQNLLGSETLVSMCAYVCSLSSLLFVCSWKSRGSLIESKPGRTISLRGWSLICLGTCVEWSIIHVLVLLLWRQPFLKGWRWQEIFQGKASKEKKHICLLFECWCMHDYLALTDCCLNSLHSLFCVVKDKA